MLRTLSLAVALSLASVGSLWAQSAATPNIVLIYADDIGYGDLSCQGATRVKTPNIDKLAAGGLRFTDGHAASSTCTPSRYAMMTGQYPWRMQGTGVLPGDAALIIKPGRYTLPSMLQKAGYKTGVVGKWHLGMGPGGAKTDWNTEIKPGAREIGFDYSYLIPATGDRVPCVYVENGRVDGLDPADPIKVSYGKPIGDWPTGKAHPELLKVHPSHGHDMTIVNGVSRIGYMTGGKSALWVDEDMADRITSKAVAFVERHKAERFFLYFATHDVHVPRVPHPRFAGKSGMGPRGDAILEFDWSVGQVLDALERNGLAENTLVILSSDNGPVVDDGYKDDAVEKLGTHKPAGPLRGGKYSLFEAGTRVPFLVRWPAKIKPGVSKALVCQMDLLSSLAALVGQTVPEDAAPDSRNLLPALLGEDPKGRDLFVHHANGLALRRGPWKFIPGRPGRGFNPATATETGILMGAQLFNLDQDLGETANLAEKHPEKVKEMAGLLETQKASTRTRP